MTSWADVSKAVLSPLLALLVLSPLLLKLAIGHHDPQQANTGILSSSLEIVISSVHVLSMKAIFLFYFVSFFAISDEVHVPVLSVSYVLEHPLWQACVHTGIKH